MAKYAVVENNKVINTVVADEDFAAEQGWIACSDEVSIEWDFVGGQFIDNRPIPDAPLAPNHLPAPTKEQLMAQLQLLQQQIAALP